MRTGTLVTLAVLLAALGIGAEPEGVEEVEVRRVLLPADRLAAELEKAKQGVLVKMPLAEFEEKLRRYREQSRPTVPTPRLVEAVYRARLFEEPSRRAAHLAGSANWTVIQPGPAPGVLPLVPLSLALKQTRFENRDALVGDFDGDQPGLLLDQAGKQTVLLDWTARGEQTPEGLLFDWRAPAAPLAQLELNLPAGRSLAVAPEGCLVSGPEPAETPDRKVWRVRFAHRSTLYLTIGSASGEAAGPAEPLVVDHVHSLHTLTPEGETSEFSFDLRVSGRGVRNLSFSCDPSLRPYQVSLPPGDPARLERMEWQPAAPGARSVLTLHLREPIAGNFRPHILCRSPLPAPPAAWTCPSLVPLPGNLIPRDETIDVRYSPLLRLEGWQAGDFRLVSARTEIDGTRSVSLGGTGLPSASPVRPRAIVRGQGVDAHARVLSWWQVGPSSSRLDIRIAFDIHHGQMVDVPVWVGPGWEVDQLLSVAPEQRLRSWGERKPTGPPRVKGGRLIVAELQPPFSAGEGGSVLTLRLRGPGLRSGSLPLPVVIPDSMSVEGVLGIAWDEDGQEGVVAVGPADGTAGPLRPLPQGGHPSEDGPWGQRVPARHVAWHGSQPQGTLTLRPRQARTRLHSRNEVQIEAGRVDVTTRLTVEPLVGSLDAFELRLSAVSLNELAPSRLEVIGKGEDMPRVRSLERLAAPEQRSAIALLASPHALGVAGLLVPGRADERWRVTLNRPLSPGRPLQLQWRASARLPGPVPLLTFADAQAEGEVHVFADDPERIFDEVASGLRELTPRQTGAGAPLRVYRHAAGPVTLLLGKPRGNGPRKMGPGAQAAIPRAELLVRVDPDGRLVQLYRFELRGWTQNTLPLLMPAESQVVRVSIDGSDATGLVPLPEPGGTLWLPVPRDRSFPDTGSPRRYEVLYVAVGQLGRLGGRVEAPAPEPPLEPLAFRRVWRLPGALSPVTQSSLVRLPGSPGRERALPTWWSTGPAALRLDRWESQQEQAVRAADARLRRAAAGQLRTLGEALRQLATGGLGEQGVTLVVDGLALAEAGLHPGRTFTVGSLPEEDDAPALSSLAPLDLTYLPCRAAALVTTRSQALAWQRSDAASSDGAAPASVLRAAADAVDNGQDSSGRFQTVPAWLDHSLSPRSPGHAAPGPALEALLPDDELAEWSDWMETGTGDSLWLVRSRTPSVVGLPLALIFLAWAWRVRSGRKARTAQGNEPGMGFGAVVLLLGWLALAALGVLWLPAGLVELAAWPLAAGVLVALWWYLRPLSRKAGKLRRAPSTHKAVGGATAAGAALLLLGMIRAQPGERPALPPESTVYLLPAGTDPGAEPAGVLVPPALLKKLERRVTPRTLAGAVLVGADYQGTVRPGGTVAQIEATLQVWCPGAGPAALVLPLEGGRLDREPLLDGAPASLTALPGPRGGDVLKINGAGAHKVQLSLLVPVSRGGELSELHFVVPRVARSRLSLRVPGKGLYLQSLGHLGAQSVKEDDMGTLLDLELGPVTATGRPESARPASPLHVRWGEAGKPGKAVPVKYREAYLWDLGRRGHAMTGVVVLDVGPGATEQFTLDVPAELLVYQLDVTRPPRESGPPRPDADTAPIRVRDWRLVPAKGMTQTPPQLQVELQSPVSGRVVMVLRCYPRATLFAAGPPAPGQATIPVLPVPRPHGTPTRNGSFLAFRVQGVEGRAGQVFRVTGLADVKEFPEFFWQSAPAASSLATAGAPTYACRIDREDPRPPILPVRLSVEPAGQTGNLRLSWRVGAVFAELRGTLEVQAKEDLGLVEFDVPAPMSIEDVSGAELREWSAQSRPGGGWRVQAWLRQSSRRGRLDFRGSAPLTRLAMPERRWGLAGAALGSATSQSLAQAAVFSLPAPRVLGMERAGPATTLELTAADGLVLTPQGLRSLGPDGTPEARQRWSYSVLRDDYAGQFVVAPAQLPKVRLVTIVELTDQQVAFRTRVVPLSQEDGLRSLRARLTGWPASAVRLDASGARVLADGTAWDVRWDRPARELVLTGRASPEEVATEGSLTLPVLHLSGVTVVERWLVLDPTAARLRPTARAQLVSPPAAPAEATALLKAGGLAWRLDMDGEPTALAEPERGEAVVGVLSSEHACVAEQGRWMHQSSWWLYHDGPGEAVLKMPAGSRLVGLSLDGTEQPLPGEAPEVRIPLKDTGARHLQVLWLTHEGIEEPPSPELPRLRGDGGPALRILVVPGGYRVGAEDGMDAGPVAAARAEMERAAGQQSLAARLLQALPDRRPGPRKGPAPEAQLADCLRRWSRHLWNAEQLLAEGSSADVSRKERVRALERLQELRDQQRELLKRYGREAPRPEPGEGAEKGPAELTRSGRLLYRIDRTSTARAEPLPGVLAEQSVEVQRSLALTGVLITLLLAVWFISSLPRLARVVQMFWPEQALLLALVGFQLFGLTWPVLLVGVVGVAARVLSLALGILSLLSRPQRPQPAV